MADGTNNSKRVKGSVLETGMPDFLLTSRRGLHLDREVFTHE